MPNPEAPLMRAPTTTMECGPFRFSTGKQDPMTHSLQVKLIRTGEWLEVDPLTEKEAAMMAKTPEKHWRWHWLSRREWRVVPITPSESR